MSDTQTKAPLVRDFLEQCTNDVPSAKQHLRELEMRRAQVGPVAVAQEALRLAALVQAGKLDAAHAEAVMVGAFAFSAPVAAALTGRVDEASVTIPIRVSVSDSPHDRLTAALRTAHAAFVAANPPAGRLMVGERMSVEEEKTLADLLWKAGRIPFRKP